MMMFVFFKQKTAYGMRISDWSSDVCSSDLLLGHDAGDALLRYFSQKLVVALPSSATIARIGGDEFAVLLPEITTQQELVTHCTAIFDALKEPFRFTGRHVDCRTSIVAAIYPDQGKRTSTSEKRGVGKEW